MIRQKKALPFPSSALLDDRFDTELSSVPFIAEL